MAALAPEALFHIGSVPITNTIVNTILVDATILSGVYFLHRNIKKIPGLFQNLIEVLINTMYSFIESIAGENVKKIFPFVMTFFIFILIANWSGLLPGVGSIGFNETKTVTAEKTEPVEKEDSHAKESKEEHFVPLMRNATSDINVTFALAIISLVTTHVFGIRATGFKDYITRFVSLNPIMLFVGLLELVSEITKIISLSFRLFGNIFAGEVVLHTVSSLFAFLFPIPFMSLEIIVGLVQALVFSILTMVFMSIMMTPHHAPEQQKGVSH